MWSLSQHFVHRNVEGFTNEEYKHTKYSYMMTKKVSKENRDFGRCQHLADE